MRANDIKLSQFVHGPLQECVKAACQDVKGLRYVEDMTDTSGFNPVHYEQAVIIAFNNGYRKIANVHLDSPFGAIKDVIKAIER